MLVFVLIEHGQCSCIIVHGCESDSTGQSSGLAQEEGALGTTPVTPRHEVDFGRHRLAPNALANESCDSMASVHSPVQENGAEMLFDTDNLATAETVVDESSRGSQNHDYF